MKYRRVEVWLEIGRKSCWLVYASGRVKWLEPYKRWNPDGTKWEPDCWFMFA